MTDLAIERRTVDALVPYARNARTHSDEQVAEIAASIREFGWTNPILVDGENGIIAGHGRLAAARKLGIEEVPVIELAHLDEAQKKALILADNKIATNAGWDEALLAIELADLDALGFDAALTGFTDDEIAALGDGDADGAGGDGDGEGGGGVPGAGSLAERFGFSPFSVLRSDSGPWQDRKRAWLALGIESEKGRGADLVGFAAAERLKNNPQGANLTFVKGRAKGDALDPVSAQMLETANGTSVFDPVMCELAYRWFCPPSGTVLDPFAGGSVRGVVASKLGRQYVGIELRGEQVAANREQGEALCADPVPVWHEADSRNLDRVAGDVAADLVFTCPPYADLEVYSDDPNDLSTMDYPAFVEAYRDIIAKACAQLRDDRFACIVIGEVRSKRGGYYGFVNDTIDAFRDAGLTYYNEAILVTPTGSLPVRVGRGFEVSRKLGKTHQNVLVFVKGDPKRATDAIGPVDFAETDTLEAVEGEAA